MIRYNTKRYWGYSSEVKPKNAQIGDRFLELDTNKEYFFSDYNQWVLISTSTGGVAGDYLPLSGGTVTGGTIFTSGVTANTIGEVNYINFKTNPTVPNPTGGTLFYDFNENALSYKPITPNNDVTIQIGQENVIRVYNDTGTQINNGQVCVITGTTGEYSKVGLAIANGGPTSFIVDGVATHDIPNGTYGFITRFGHVHDINLSSFSNGEYVYLSQTSRGALASFSALTFSGRVSQVGYVISAATNGILEVSILNEDYISNITGLQRNILNGNNSSTGVYSFTGLSVNTSTTFNIAPVNAWIINNTYSFSTSPQIQNISYTGQTGLSVTNIATSDSTYVLLTSATTIVQQVTYPTPQQRRQNVYLGKIVHPNRSTILSVNNNPDYEISPMSALRDLWSPIRLINDGVIPSASGTGLSFLTSAGTLWGNGINWTSNELNPNSVSISAKTPASFFYRTQTGGTSGSVSVIDPTKYDLNGVITSVGTAGSNDATNQRIYLYPTGQINVLYGQQVHGTLAEAISNISSESFTVYPNAATTGILIGILSVRNDIVADGQNLSNTSYAKFTLVSKFGESIGGTGGISTTTLQQAYDNSTQPEIVINSTLDGLSIKNGTGNSNNVTNLLEGLNSGGTTTSFIRADGLISGSSLSAPTISATTYYGLPSSTFTGGTVNGATIFTNGLSANTLIVSASTNPVRFIGIQSANTDTNILTTDANGVVRAANVSTSGLTTKSFGIVIDGSGAAITTGIKGDLISPYNMRISSWTIVADTSGSIVIDIWKNSYANFPPLVGDTIITGGTAVKPNLSSTAANISTGVTGWNTTISSGDILRFNVDSASTVKRITLSLTATLS